MAAAAPWETTLRGSDGATASPEEEVQELLNKKSLCYLDNHLIVLGLQQGLLGRWR